MIAMALNRLDVARPILELILSIYFPIKAVFQITLAVSLETTNNPTSLCSCPVFGFVEIIPITSIKPLPIDRTRTDRTCLIEDEHATNAKLGFKKVRHCFRVQNGWWWCSPSYIAWRNHRFVVSRCSSWCDSIIYRASRLSRAMFVSTKTGYNASFIASSWVLDYRRSTFFISRANPILCFQI